MRKDIAMVAVIVSFACMMYVASEESQKGDRKIESSQIQCDLMEQSRLRLALKECAAGTMHDTWGEVAD